VKVWCREREDEEVEWRPTCVVHLTRPEGGGLGALHTCFNLKDTLKTTFFVGSSDGELVYADWIKPEVITICCHSVCAFQEKAFCLLAGLCGLCQSAFRKPDMVAVCCSMVVVCGYTRLMC